MIREMNPKSKEMTTCKEYGKVCLKHKFNQYKIPPRMFCDRYCHFKWIPKNPIIGYKNWSWKGTKADYSSIHKWISAHYGKANKCENKKCPKKSVKYEWANISGTYKRERSDYKMLCHSCHQLRDRRLNNLGKKDYVKKT